MIWILIIYTVLPAGFVGPVLPTQISPDVPPIYLVGPSIKFPVQYTPDGQNRLVIVVDPHLEKPAERKEVRRQRRR